MNINWNQDLYIKAYRFAANAHLGQFVPGTEISYIMHLSLVSMEVIAALSVDTSRNGNLAVQCALLHDVIEDTPASFKDVAGVFGVDVAYGVKALSKDGTVDKQCRMQDSLRRIQEQPQEVWMVKLADRITNLQTPPPHWSKEKIAEYRTEAQVIYDALHPASPYLAQRLQQKIEEYAAYL